MTFIFPGELASVYAGGLSGWDVNKQGYGGTALAVFADPAQAVAPHEIVIDFVAPGPLAIGPITENFPTIEDPLSTGGQWLHKAPAWGHIKVVNISGTHVAAGTQDGSVLYNDSYAYLSPTVWPPSFTDYSVQATVNINGSGGSTDEFECVLRVTDSATPGPNGTVTVYECNYQFYGAYAQLATWNGTLGSYSIITAGAGTPYPQLVTGDTLKATIKGQTVLWQHNGTTLFNYTITGAEGQPNPPYTTGQPGFAKYYEGSGGDTYGFTQVIITSTPYTAPVITGVPTYNILRSLPANSVIGQIFAVNNPTSWTVSLPSPSGSAGYFTIDAFANIILTSAGAGNLTASSSYSFQATATNSFGSNGATVTVNVSGTGAILTNNNRTVIDSGVNVSPLSIRGVKPILTTGTTASRRRYIEIQIGITGDNTNVGFDNFLSVGMADPTWNPATATPPVGSDVGAHSFGVFISAVSGVPNNYFLVNAGTPLYTFAGGPAQGDIIGIAVDTSGSSGTATLFWFNVNGVWLNKGIPTSTFPGLTNYDVSVSGVTQMWPACSTDSYTHIVINPARTQLHRPPGFVAWG